MKNIFLLAFLLVAMANSIGKTFDDLVTMNDVKAEVKQHAAVGNWDKLSQLATSQAHSFRLVKTSL